MTDQSLPPKSDLGVRIVSAIVMVVIAGGAFWAGGIIFQCFVAAIALGMLWEYWGLINKFAKNYVSLVGWLFVGTVYILVPTMAVATIGSESSNAAVVLLPIILAVIATDVGAYFAGRAIGGPKIAPSISPSKTWSGLFGGMALAGIATAAWSSFFIAQFDVRAVSSSLAVGAAIAVVAQSGDFFESWIKRKAGAKDSGNLIPGHGGLLDRLDGLLAVLLVSTLALLLIANSMRVTP